jgi:uncharacterized surface protein with fasciclin (FAS1) repeats
MQAMRRRALTVPAPPPNTGIVPPFAARDARTETAMNRRRALDLLVSAGVLAALAACGGGQPRGPAGPDLIGTARANDLDRLARAIGSADLVETLSGPGPYTIFAPTDRAFSASNAGRLDGDGLRRLLAYHVVPGQLTADFLEGMDVNHTTLLGSSLNVDGTGAGIRVNDANVLRADLMASNGVIHVIDRVLTPR